MLIIYVNIERRRKTSIVVYNSTEIDPTEDVSMNKVDKTISSVTNSL